MGTSKEMYDKLVTMFRANNANQVLFFKNKLKNIKKGKDESIQSYFMRLTEIKNDLLAIGEAIADQDLTLNALGGLPQEWYVFNTIILNNNVIPDFDELLTRCTQEETKVMERDHTSNGNGGDPTTFTAHAKKRNSAGPRNQNHGRAGHKGTTCSKERGRLPLIEVEMGNLSRDKRIPGMMNLMLLIGKMNIFLYLPSLLHLLPTPWTIG